MTISQAARHLGVSSFLMKRWEAEGLLKPSARTPGGHRRYTEEDLAPFAAEREPGHGGAVRLVRKENA